MTTDRARLRIDETPGSSKPSPMLTVHAMQRRFGGLMSVDVEHLEVETGVVTSLIGPNGAGKTTLFNLLTGFDRPTSGTCSFLGQDVTGIAPHRLAGRGMVRTFQLTRAMTKLTVLQNIKLAGQGQRGEKLLLAPFRTTWRRQERDLDERAQELLERFGLAKMGDQFAGTLSGGQRRLLELSRALMLQPRMLLLDEPMGGVNPALAERIGVHLRELADEGMTILLVEHDMDMVMSLSDWVVVLAEGKVIAEGRPSTIAGDEAVIEAYLGVGYLARQRAGQGTAPDRGEPR